MSRPRSAANYGPERGTTYLLHFDRPYRHARHYTGWTTDLKGRLDAHRRGDGSKFMRYVRAAGIGFTLARTWPGTTKDREDSIKHQGGASRFCPECGAVPGTPRLATDKPAAQADRRPMWQADRDGQWADGTPIIYDPDLTWQQARADRAALQIPEPDPASQAELAALDELERRWTQQEEPMFGSKARAARRQAAESERVRQVGERYAAAAAYDEAERAARQAAVDGYRANWEAGGEPQSPAETGWHGRWSAIRDAGIRNAGRWAEWRAAREADRLFALADELEKQAPPRPNYAREITAERAARMRERLGEDLVQDARAQAAAEAGAHEPELQGAERDAEIDRLADAFPEPGIGGTTGIALSALSDLLPDLVPADGPAPQSGREPAEPLFGPRPGGTYADAIDAEVLVEQLAAAQEADRMWSEPHLPQSHAEEVTELDAAGWYAHVDPNEGDLSAEETQAFEQAERERWAQVDRDAEYMARQAAQYYGPEIADLLGIEPGDAVQAPDSPGWERGEDAAAWSPALELEVGAGEVAPTAEDRLVRDLDALADEAELSRRQERRALAREHIALEAQAQCRAALVPELKALAGPQGAVAAAARQTAAQMREARREAEADAYGVAADLQDTAGWAAANEPEREPMERMPPEAGSSPALAPVAAAQSAGTAHADPALAERGWQADSHGVYVGNPDAEAPGAHCGLAGYQAGIPDHNYGSPVCAEADPEGAHFGRGPGEPMDAGRWPVLQADYGRMYIGQPQAQAEAV
jgi:predicted GIY-YIG superfamily endonuclease